MMVFRYLEDSVSVAKDLMSFDVIPSPRLYPDIKV